MSTKCTIIYRDEPNDFHLYYDISDGKIHLRLDRENLDFVSTPNNITVEIPKDILEAIIQEVKKPDFKLSDFDSWNDWQEPTWTGDDSWLEEEAFEPLQGDDWL